MPGDCRFLSFVYLEIRVACTQTFIVTVSQFYLVNICLIDEVFGLSKCVVKVLWHHPVPNLSLVQTAVLWKKETHWMVTVHQGCTEQVTSPSLS